MNKSIVVEDITKTKKMLALFFFLSSEPFKND